MFKINKENSEEIVICQDPQSKYIALNSIYLKITKYHSCNENYNRTEAFYDCFINNNFKEDFTNWKLTISLDRIPVLTGYWNARARVSGKDIILIPESKRANTIKAGTNFPIEFYLEYLHPFNFTKITLTGNRIHKLTKYPLHYFVIISLIIITVAIIVYSIVYKNMNNKIKILNLVSKRSATIIEQTMKTFVNFIDAKDQYTKGHSTRVAEYSRLIARRMGYDEQFQQDIYYMGLMHDIGKITVPDSILNKTSHLTTEEWAVIQLHTENGARLLQNFTVIPEIKDAVLYHHERYDGKGYLHQLKGEEIPLCARIICVADSFDAMNTNRCYRLKYSRERIIKEIERCSAKQFDPTIASIMIELITDGTI